MKQHIRKIAIASSILATVPIVGFFLLQKSKFHYRVYYDQMLNNHGLSEDLTFSKPNWQQSLFASKVTTTGTIQSDGTPIEFDIITHADHIPWFGVHGLYLFKQQVSLIPKGELKSKLDQALNDPIKLNIDSEANFEGTMHNRLELGALVVKQSNSFSLPSGLSVETTLNLANREVSDFEFNLPKMSFIEGASSLDLNDFNVRFNGGHSNDAMNTSFQVKTGQIQWNDEDIRVNIKSSGYMTHLSGLKSDLAKQLFQLVQQDLSTDSVASSDIDKLAENLWTQSKSLRFENQLKLTATFESKNAMAKGSIDGLVFDYNVFRQDVTGDLKSKIDFSNITIDTMGVVVPLKKTSITADLVGVKWPVDAALDELFDLSHVKFNESTLAKIDGNISESDATINAEAKLIPGVVANEPFVGLDPQNFQGNLNATIKQSFVKLLPMLEPAIEPFFKLRDQVFRADLKFNGGKIELNGSPYPANSLEPSH